MPFTQHLGIILGMGALIACSPKTPHSSASQAGSDSHSESQGAPEDPNRTVLTAMVRKNLGITFAPVERRQVAQTLRIPGSLEYAPLARREFRLPLDGHVSFEVDHLQRVEPGQVLFRFQSPQWPDYQHEILEGEQAATMALAQSAVALAKLEEAKVQKSVLVERLSTLERAEIRRADLEAELALIEASLPRLRTEQEVAMAALRNAERTKEHALHRAATVSSLSIEALLAPVEVDGETAPRFEHMQWIEVRAQSAGIVETLAVANGSFVQSPELILTTVDPSQVRFRGLALQSDLADIVQAESAYLLPPDGLAYRSEPPIPAELVTGLDAHPEERTQVLYAIPQGPSPWMRPGIATFLEVVRRSSQGPTLALPNASIVQDGLQHVFFRRDQEDPNTVVRMEADLGLSDGRWTQILSGVSLDDEVVVDGAFELQLASERRGGLPKGGHFHADGSFHTEDD